MKKNQPSVPSILYGNAIFSGISGLIFTLASKTVANFLGVDGSLFVIL